MFISLAVCLLIFPGGDYAAGFLLATLSFLRLGFGLVRISGRRVGLKGTALEYARPIFLSGTVVIAPLIYGIPSFLHRFSMPFWVDLGSILPPNLPPKIDQNPRKIDAKMPSILDSVF